MALIEAVPFSPLIIDVSPLELIWYDYSARTVVGKLLRTVEAGQLRNFVRRSSSPIINNYEGKHS